MGGALAGEIRQEDQPLTARRSPGRFHGDDLIGISPGSPADGHLHLA